MTGALKVLTITFDTWTAAKPNGEKGYNQFFNEWWEKDTRDLLLRDRNHPSVIIYSVGNEIRDNLNDSTGFRKYKDQQDLIHKLDPGRPVTMALFRPNVSKVYSNGFAELMDIAAVDNGDTNGHEPYQASERHVFHGKCIAIIKAKTASGNITVTASSPGLISGSVNVTVKNK